MEFKEKLISSHLAFEEDLNLFDPVHETRANALKIFEKILAKIIIMLLDSFLT